MRDPLESAVAEAWPPSAWQAVPVVIAVSGGPDSVALATAAARLRGDGPSSLRLAHFDHQWRDTTDERQLVAELGRRWSLPCDFGAAAARGSEATARAQRYAFLSEVVRQHSARFLVTAHTADDQVETILHHLLRGTGLAGLAGIRPARELMPGVSLLRPMLQIRKSEVRAYLKRQEQAAIEDPSNSDPAFTRNRIRTRLLPMLERDFPPGPAEPLLRLSEHAADAQQALETIADRLLNDARQTTAGGWRLDAARFRQEPSYLVRCALMRLWRQSGWPEQAMTADHWRALEQLLHSPGARDFPGAVHARATPEALLLRHEAPKCRSDVVC